jgi:hypothetical protein
LPEWEEFPRPEADYYERRHEYLTQGDIIIDVPISQLGPDLISPAYLPDVAFPLPERTIPVLTNVWTAGFGMLISNTCDFRHPSAADIQKDPYRYRNPGAIYHSGFLRVAPIFPLDECPFLVHSDEAYTTLRQYDHIRRLMYLPPLTDVSNEGTRQVLGECVVALHLTDLSSIDLLGRLERVTQLSYVARQQLCRKLVWLDTGALASYEDFDPDLN